MEMTLWITKMTKNDWSDFTDGIETVYKWYTKLDWYKIIRLFGYTDSIYILEFMEQMVYVLVYD